jgi:hypothetical protein
MINHFLDTLFPPKRTKKILSITIVLFPILMIAVNYVFAQSGYPATFTESQLSFSGEEIKSHYQVMSTQQIRLYIFAQLIDYAYLCCYGLLILSLGIFIGRKVNNFPKIKTACYTCSIIGMIAACCDAIENAFILAMASNSLQFNNLLAIIHSVFASIKFGLLGLSIISLSIIALFFIVLRIIKSSKN